MNTHGISTPDFIVVGGWYDDEVILFASKKLTQVELQEIIREMYPILNEKVWTRPLFYDIYITAKMRDYVVVRAKNYPDAWRTLFDIWDPQPKQEAPKALPQRCIEDGQPADWCRNLPHEPKALP